MNIRMGNYLFNTDVLIQALAADPSNPASSHDFGRDILRKEEKACN